MVRRAHDDRPGTSGCARGDWLCHVICNYLEFGSITAVKDSAIIHSLRIGVSRREVTPGKLKSAERSKDESKLVTY